MFCKHHMININLYTSWFTNQLDSRHLAPLHSNTWGPYIDTVQPVKDGCTLACLKNPRELQHTSNGVNPLYSRKDVSEMVIVFCVSLIIADELMYVIKSGKHVYQKSFFCVIPIVPESVISIRYQCPGVTVPKCRRFWRALIWQSRGHSILVIVRFWHTFTRLDP